tara:strand:- start:26465 stop:27292 length:828 start_codon:yes stop_codon:yes gene_type:complete
MNNLSILISSTDSYQDCWDPFFSLLEKNFENISEFNVILVSDTKQYTKKKFVKNISASKNGEVINWSKRILYALNSIDSEIIFFLFDDYFLMSKLNTHKFLKMFQLIKEDNEIGNIKFEYNSNSSISNYKGLNQLWKFAKYKASLQPGFWRKDVLIDLLQNGETPWQFEILGTVRSFCYQKKFLVVDNMSSRKIYDSKTYGGIVKGKWVLNEYEKIKQICGTKITSQRGFINYNPKNNGFKRKIRLFVNTFNDINLIYQSLLFFFKNLKNLIKFN